MIFAAIVSDRQSTETAELYAAVAIAHQLAFDMSQRLDRFLNVLTRSVDGTTAAEPRRMS
jgi:hypothetical protein